MDNENDLKDEPKGVVKTLQLLVGISTNCNADKRKRLIREKMFTDKVKVVDALKLLNNKEYVYGRKENYKDNKYPETTIKVLSNGQKDTITF